jgi:oligoribonuclease
LTTTPSNTDNQLLWLDLETTGVNELAGDEIIEVGCILTTESLVTLGEFNAVVRPSTKAKARLVANQIVFDMHTINGLLDELNYGNAIEDVEQRLIHWLSDLKVPHPLTLAGSGVSHFDSRFISAQIPYLHRRLNRFVIDIGIVRRAHRMWTGNTVSDINNSKTHRTLDDVRCHLTEARAYAELWRGPRSDGPETQAVIIASRSAAPAKPCSDWATLAYQ